MTCILMLETNPLLERRLGMKRYEYMTVDLSAEPSFNVHVKLDRYIAMQSLHSMFMLS